MKPCAYTHLRTQRVSFDGIKHRSGLLSLDTVHIHSSDYHTTLCGSARTPRLILCVAQRESGMGSTAN